MLVISRDKVIAELKKLKREFPNKRNFLGKRDTCEHWNKDGTPSCIIGHCLYRLGIRSKDIYTSKFIGKFQYLSTNVDRYIYRKPITITKSANNVLVAVQYQADGTLDNKPIKWKDIKIYKKTK